jgi:hypothetical protein
VLQVIEVSGSKFVRISEFYDQVGLTRKKYRRFINRTIVDNPIPSKNVDYIEIEPHKNDIGRPRTEFLISLQFLKTLCFEVGTPKSRDVKVWADSFVDFNLKKA